MSGASECMESPRIAGAALAMYLTKRPLKQAPALDPVVLAILKLMSFCERNLYLRCMAGFCLMCIYGRLRVSDMHRIVNLSVKGDFVEGKSEHLRSHCEAEDAPRQILSRRNREQDHKPQSEDNWLTYMGTYGVDYTHTELLGYHLTQHRSAINYQRSALSAPLRTMCGMLKEVQEGKFVPLAPRDEVFCRDTKPKGVLEQMVQTMGMELQELCEKFLGFPATSLHEGDAHPELRALWEMMGQPFMQEVPVVEQVDSPTEVVSYFGYEDADRVKDDPATDGSGDESNCSDSCSSSAESALASVVRDSEFATFRPVSKSAVTEMVYRHKRTKMIHYGHDSFEPKTACGRALGSTYFRFFGDIEKAWPHCRNCFGSM
ncbi:unnamed protein product [Cladocopium goreaui]|uniref:Cation channel sperm-associated protein 1 n=1 Tax=Cladocopium goreaui TaxID=2562237 RepID=A0A9P1DHK1_9DINO|nr:unnamed protein product [Cladocopium goreaui]